MAKKYSESFKRDAVKLMASRGTKTVAEVAASLRVTSAMLFRWQATYGKSPPSRVESQEDIEALRRRLRVVEQENAFLKRACAFLAKEGS